MKPSRTRYRVVALAIGLAVMDAIARCTSCALALKWPNDVLLDGRKLGGILVEVASAQAPVMVVVGVGINACELAENPFLDEWRVQDLNANPRLSFAAAEFDGAAICVSIQHLTRPCELIREVGRVLKPGAPLIVTFSNCCLPTRAIACWHLLDDAGHLCLIAHYFAEAGNWTDIRCLDRTPPGGGDPLYAVIGRSLGAVPPVAHDYES